MKLSRLSFLVVVIGLCSCARHDVQDSVPSRQDVEVRRQILAIYGDYVASITQLAGDLTRTAREHDRRTIAKAAALDHKAHDERLNELLARARIIPESTRYDPARSALILTLTEEMRYIRELIEVYEHIESPETIAEKSRLLDMRILIMRQKSVNRLERFLY